MKWGWFSWGMIINDHWWISFPKGFTVISKWFGYSYKNTKNISFYLNYMVNDQCGWVLQDNLMSPFFQSSPSSYSQLVRFKSGLLLRAFLGCAGHEFPAEPERIQLPFPSMSSLIIQLVAPVLTLKYTSEPDSCWSTCKQSMNVNVCHQHKYCMIVLHQWQLLCFANECCW